ncbi:MAG: flagellin [Planctomycetes bacterium]|nr:flagellin [Planctomycetota bacterium]MCB9885601.1 flagellin [Planctomycetota bacterium]
MSFSIQGGGANPGLRGLHQTQQRLQNSMARLATNKRINSAADDAAGLAIAARLGASVRGLAQGERNLADGVSMARTAEGSLANTHESLARMRELTVQAQNGTLSAEDRGVIQAEYDQLAEQIDQNAAGARFGDQQSLLDGSQSGAAARTIVDGQGQQTTLDLPDVRSQALGVAGLDVGDPQTLSKLDLAIDQVSSVRSKLGATESTLQRSAANSAVTRENEAAAQSRIEDADVAQEVANITRDRILHSLQITGIRVSGQTARRAVDLLG